MTDTITAKQKNYKYIYPLNGWLLVVDVCRLVRFVVDVTLDKEELADVTLEDFNGIVVCALFDPKTLWGYKKH